MIAGRPDGGLISGAFSICANILLAKSLAREDVGICATIYRLNLMPAALLALVFFKEPVTLARLAAIAAGVEAVWLFSWPSRKSSKKLVFSTAIWLTALAGLLRAGMGLSDKAGLLSGADEYGLLVINGLAWIIGGVICHFAVDRKRWRIPRATLAFGALSGALVCGIALFMVLALKNGDASLVLPVTQMSFALTALIGIVFIKEKLSLRKCLGLALAMLCILLMGTNR